MSHKPPVLHISQSPGAQVNLLAENCWRLEVAASSKPAYRLAQLDDHAQLRRGDFKWKPPLTLSLQARISAENIPGTWGFGFWNDPFSFLLGSDRQKMRFPTLPQAAWFFHASPQNYLSFRDDLPAAGFLAASFSSKKVPLVLLALASPALGLTLLPQTANLVRQILRREVQQSATSIQLNVTEWHSYKLEWESGQLRFIIDSKEAAHTNIVPHVPLCLVIWIDNQYAALPPGGRLRYGSLPNLEPAWMEVREIELLQHTDTNG